MLIKSKMRDFWIADMIDFSGIDKDDSLAFIAELMMILTLGTPEKFEHLLSFIKKASLDRIDRVVARFGHFLIKDPLIHNIILREAIYKTDEASNDWTLIMNENLNRIELKDLPYRER